MDCPVCQNSLSPVQAGQVTVDVCIGGCGGIWFDHFELQKFDEPHEVDGELLGSIATKRPGMQIDYSQKRHCPKCQDIIMMRHFFSPTQRVEVDECPNCGGYWLDAGELALIRQGCQTELERKKAVERYFEEVSSQQIQAMQNGGVEQIRRARKLSNLFRFTAPIQYHTSTS
jgi:Zn-finger nucleic acid-binding protein